MIAENMAKTARVAPRARIVRVVQITDTHVFAGPDELYDGVDTCASLNAVVDAIRVLQPVPDFILATGDLVNDPMAAAYERLLTVLQRLPAPVCCMAGNHDRPDQLGRTLNAANVTAPRLVQCGDWSLVLLNTCVPGREGGRLADSELAFLDAYLQLQESCNVLVCLHHPPVSVGSTWMDAMGLENGDALFEILDTCKRVRGVLWGHIHQEFDQWRNGVRLLGTPSTCVQFTPGADRYIKADMPPAYRMLHLRPDGEIETDIVPVP